MKAFTIVTVISSMALGLQGVLGVPLATANVAKRYDQGKSITQRKAQGNCWEAPNGQIQCSEKREVTSWAPCWDPDRGEIECVKVEPKNKRDVRSNSYETSDGQIQRTNKRQAGTDSVPPPAPTNPGTTSSCAQWYTIHAPDDGACQTVLADGNLELSDFRRLNPFVNEGCTNLWVGYTYCIRTMGPQASSPPAATPPTLAPPASNLPATAPPASDPPVASPPAATSSASSPSAPNTPASSASYGTSITGTMQPPDRVTQYYYKPTSTATPM